jgi:CRISPR-associated endonuclease/helicase Cas3
MNVPLPTYINYWGKFRTDEKDQYTSHPLAYHALDVAAVGRVLFKGDPLLRKRLNTFHIQREELETLICFLLAIHDIGKFSTPSFQQLGDLRKIYVGHHSDLGYLLWKEHLLPVAIEEGWLHVDGADLERCQDIITPLLRAVCGHHGSPPDEGATALGEAFLPEDIRAAEAFARDCASLFLRDASLPLHANRKTVQKIKGVSWVLAGLCVLADWIGSDRNYFPYQKASLPLPEYFEKIALPGAELALRNKGAIPSTPAQERGLSALFPDLFPRYKPTPLQQYVATLPLGRGAHLFIIEDATGSGKTEAALTLAHRLMATEEGEGIYIALPTMATANAMYCRMEKITDSLFCDDTYSTILAHSASHLYGMMKAYLDGETVSESPGTTWLADNRKKALLAQIGVGTIDQALLAILPVRHQSLRILGLARNILIVDEVHACDRYMHELLKRLLEFHGALGGSAILLSATLPTIQRRELAESFARRIPEMNVRLEAEDYPLLTHISPDGLDEKVFPMEQEKLVTVTLTASLEEALAEIVRAAKERRCACWIRNTVDDAVEAWEQLSSILPKDSVHLFHARFALGDRLRIEKTVLDLFGKESADEARAGQVLVATQVVEQSLDLDFDFMVSDLAPIDRIIQRAGRLHRHERGDRGEARLLILSPEPVIDPEEDWYRSLFPRGAAVYEDHARVWLTARILSQKGSIAIPGDAHPFIEAVFGKESGKAIPDVFLNLTAEVRGKECADASFAIQNALKLKNGYRETSGAWKDDSRTPTRLGEPSVTLRLARWDGEHILPWADEADPRVAWDLSQVSVREKQVARPDEFTGPLADAVKEVEARVGGRDRVIVPLEFENGIWAGLAQSLSENPVRVIYDRKRGLKVSRIE